MEEKKKMGIGPLGTPQVVIGRQFRFTLEADGLSEYHAQRASINFVTKTIRASLMEFLVLEQNQRVDLHGWLTAPKGPIVLTTYDGCGSKLYEYTFYGQLKIVNDQCDFDYNSSDVLMRDVLIQYETCVRKDFNNVKDFDDSFLYQDLAVTEVEVDSKCNNGFAVLVSGGQEYGVHISGKPTMDVESIDVNHLNGKMTLPGKAKWQKMVVKMSEGTFNAVRHDLKNRELSLRILDAEKKPVECWDLKQVIVTNVNYGSFGSGIELGLNFSSVKLTGCASGC